MARGYPAPKAPPVEIPRLVPEGVCVICKRRPAKVGSDKCVTCIEALAG